MGEALTQNQTGPCSVPRSQGDHPRQKLGQVWAGRGPGPQPQPQPRGEPLEGHGVGGWARGEAAVDPPTVQGGVGAGRMALQQWSRLPPWDPEDREEKMSGRSRGGELRSWKGGTGPGVGCRGASSWAQQECAGNPGRGKDIRRLRRRSLGEVEVAAARHDGGEEAGPSALPHGAVTRSQ